MKNHIYIFYPEDWINLKGEFTCIIDASKNINVLSLIPKNQPYISKLLKTKLYCNSKTGYISPGIRKKINAKIIEKNGEERYPFVYTASLNKEFLCEFLFNEKLKKKQKIEIKKIILNEKLKKRRSNILFWKIFYSIFK